MATQSVAPYYFPEVPNQIGVLANFSNFLLDAASEKAAYIIQAPKTGNVSKVAWRTNVVTTGATLDIRLETLNASGDPSGTLFGTNTNGSHVLADTDDSKVNVTTLTAAAAVTKGDKLAVVIVNPATGFGNFNVAAFQDADADFPYSDHFTTAWAKAKASPCVGLEYSDGSYAVISNCYPIDSNPATVFNSGSAPDEIGIIFQLPVPVRVTGCWIWCDLDAAADVKLYNSDGSTVLLSRSLVGAEDAATTMGLMLFYFSSTATLAKATNYRLTLVPTTVTNVGLQEFTVNAAAVMDAFSGGQAIHRTQRTDAGAWTQTTTQRPFMGLILDGLDDGVGAGGGLLTNPGMAGGMRG